MKTTALNLTENFRRSSFHARQILFSNPEMCDDPQRMNEQSEIPPKQNYKWPWFVLAAVLLFIVLAVVWMSFAVHREKEERDFNAPIPMGAK
jgi:hypothetical protein